MAQVLKGALLGTHAISEDPRFTRAQRLQRIHKLHDQVESRLRQILSPEQYRRFRAMRGK